MHIGDRRFSDRKNLLSILTSDMKRLSPKVFRRLGEHFILYPFPKLAMDILLRDGGSACTTRRKSFPINIVQVWF